MNSQHELPPPDLEWKENGTPVAAEYNDVYYQKENGLEESRYVFLQHNGLPERLKDQQIFTIAETGFGTGLNLLCVWQMWGALPHPKPKLHFITTENQPLNIETLEKAHQAWPELANYSDALIAAYPPAVMGAHRRYLSDGNIIIDWLFGDVVQSLSHCQLADSPQQVDAWFLDGFAPSKNPDMWSSDLFKAIADLSKPNTTFATFTAAGEVKRGLQSVGFGVLKTKGYGTKRDMLIGTYQTTAAPLSNMTPTIIIGGGIAGLSAAWRLAQRGESCLLLEKNAHIAQGASGNPASALTPFYPKQWNQRGRMLHNSFMASLQLINHLQDKGHTINAKLDGMLMLHIQDGSKRSERLADWQNQLELPDDIRTNLSKEEASDIAGIPLDHGGWHYAHGGWVSMPQLCQALREDAGEHLQIQTNTQITSLSHDGNQWHLVDQKDERYAAAKVIITCAHAAQELLPELPLEAVHGQLIQFDAPESMQSLQCPIHAGHTLIPIGNDRLSWGASFRHQVHEAEAFEEDTHMLWQDLRHAFDGIPDTPANLKAWAGLRCTHPSRMPLIGPAPNQPDGLYLHIAHGARGALTGMQPYTTNSFIDLSVKQPSCEIATG
ncbi:MAG: FAD-dependent 5-carboxymethylaminomethyl-2-thiouridine(34) oxidoreductase MnmC [Rickettsiales bacterium]|nr:FAD-dependent 5-carboxymethylaminomethyl-2-thiouridine(34) oxidoreductase MnmC [Rickettsiales bacterium]